MDSHDRFHKYYGRFFRRLTRDAAPWARDNIGFAGTMLVAPLLVVYLRDRSHAIDWELVRATLWIYLGAFFIYVLYHVVRTPWKLDGEYAEELQTLRDADTASKAKLEELTLNHSNDRPLLGLNVHSVEGELGWRTTAVPVAFTIQHLSGRVPTSIRFDVVPSKLGQFSLRFDPLPHADPAPHQSGLRFEVLQAGVPQLSAKDWATTQQYEGELLRLFVHDSPPDMSEIRYDLIAHFKDSDEERSQTFYLVFDMHRFRFSANTV